MKESSGFSSVELLVTLFIAAAFLFAGYQLATQVSRSSAEATRVAKVSNVVYERMRKKANEVTDQYPSCDSSATGTTVLPDETVPNVGTVKITLTVSCPAATAVDKDLFLVTAKGEYKDGQVSKELSHAVYAN